MCGIVGAYGRAIGPAVEALAHRGPDGAGCVDIGELTLGHRRLAILDPEPRSDQPFRYRRTTLVYNGEMWNWRALRDALEREGLTFRTHGDTEVVTAALDYWGEAALDKFDGMFALAWTTDGAVTYLARDRFGEAPLHLARIRRPAFASERKALAALGVSQSVVTDVGPGEIVSLTADGARTRRYYEPPCAPQVLAIDEAAAGIRTLVEDGCRARAISDVPVCTLLSGGIDSAAIAWGLKRTLGSLVAYTAVMTPSSSDLRAARLVATALDIRLVEVTVPTPTPDDLARVIRVIEMPFKAQVEIGWPCLVLAERMRADGFKVTFSGEGSDELWASYGFAYYAIAAGANWHAYRRDLFLGQARKNFARCNKVFLSRGVECRLPFLQRPLVEYALSLPQSAVADGRSHPKAVMQRAFRDVLPAAVTGRAKLAFQDGLGIKPRIAAALASPERYYRAEFERAFPGARA